MAARNHDFLSFAETELKNRKIFSYPPFGKLISIRITGLHEAPLVQEAQALVKYLKDLTSQFDSLGGIQILGPTPAPLARIKNRYRYHILLKGPGHQALNHVANQALDFVSKHLKKSKFQIDVDPYSLI